MEYWQVIWFGVAELLLTSNMRSNLKTLTTSDPKEAPCFSADYQIILHDNATAHNVTGVQSLYINGCKY